MSYLPHINVITKPGHNDATVKVTFVKTIVAPGDTQGRPEITDEKFGPSLEELSPHAAHDTAKFLHEVLELQDELKKHEQEEADASDFFNHDVRMGQDLNENESQAEIADHAAYIRMMEKQLKWYEQLIETVRDNPSFTLCPSCCPAPKSGGESGEIACNGGLCRDCGGLGYLQPRPTAVEDPRASNNPDDWLTNLTDRARKAVYAATTFTHDRRSIHITEEALMFGILLSGDESVACTALTNCCINTKELINILSGEKYIPLAPDIYVPMLSAACTSALVRANNEAKRLGHSFVGVEHLLIGLLRGALGLLRFNALTGVPASSILKEIYELLGVEPPK